MLLAGDERGRTQGGNNNAYCQSNELSWIHWDETPENQTLFRFVQQLIQFRKAHPIFRRTKFLRGQAPRKNCVADLKWIHNSGNEMSMEQWSDQGMRHLGMLLAGESTTA